MQKKIIIANFKAYFTPDQLDTWCEQFLASLRSPAAQIEVVLAMPIIALPRIQKRMQGSTVTLAAQTLSSFPQGSYTGSTPAAWLRDIVQYSLVGHRERRKYFHEGVQDVTRQAAEAISEEIKPIVCVEGEQFIPQLASFTDEQRDHLIWAFTPETGGTLEMSRDLQEIENAVGQMILRSGRRPVLYGGGVTDKNCASLLQIAGLSGLLMGKACHDPILFAQLINQL
jgi:triosephosphate isomerase